MGALQVYFAGLWQVFWPIMIGGGVVAALLAIAYFTPIGKRYFVEAAIIVALGLFSYQFGLHQAASRCRAQNIAATKVINRVVNRAVRHTRTPQAIRSSDPWDQPNY